MASTALRSHLAGAAGLLAGLITPLAGLLALRMAFRPVPCVMFMGPRAV